MIDVELLKEQLIARVQTSNTPAEVAKAPEFRELYAQIPMLPADERGEFGRRVNELKKAIDHAIDQRKAELSAVALPAIDVTAPFDVNSSEPTLLPASKGTLHPLTQEIERVSGIFNRMGFVTEQF